MDKNYASEPINQIRRSDRAVSDESWLRMFLQRAPFGVLATANDGQPFINTNLFVYDETVNAIYLHTAPVGRTRANVEADGRVCFSASVMGRLLPADEALEFSVEYAGVTVFGRARIISEESEKATALQLLLDKYFPHLSPGKDYQSITQDELQRTTVFRVDIEAWSAKKKEVGDDFSGALDYEAHTPKNFWRG
jgi:nitroimidazol reductase NimA-like FMN-containing flavoprotein (pyridoxamine 5'-phosphate oxidase superfamily)